MPYGVECAQMPMRVCKWELIPCECRAVVISEATDSSFFGTGAPGLWPSEAPAQALPEPPTAQDLGSPVSFSWAAQQATIPGPAAWSEDQVG